MKKKYDNQIVSVIIPVYNAEKYLMNTLESVLNQTYQDMELVIVDDCSKDNSVEIIQEYQKKYKNILCFYQKNNTGAAAARNKAIQMAKGRYLAFIDADDIWTMDKIEMQLKHLKEKKSAICYTGLCMIDERGNVIKKMKSIPKEISYKDLLKNTVIATSSVMIDRNIVGEIQMPLRKTGEDYATWLSILHNGNIAVGINQALLKYRIRANSLSSNKKTVFGEFWYAQVVQEKIFPLCMIWNFGCFCINAIKKHYF